MAESILVTGKKISSMELVTNVTGNEKIPTGQPDDLAVTPNQIADHTIARGDLASQEDLSQVEVSLGTQITDLESDVTSNNNSIRGLIAAEEAARIAADNLKVDKQGSVSSVAGRVGDVALAPSDVLVEVFGSQEDVNKYIPKPFLIGYTYGLGERVVLNGGEVVKSLVDGNVGNPNVDMIGWVSAVSDSLSDTIQTFTTPEAGVDPVTGVAEGAYFNVRSSSDESYADEYQNVGGSAVATGKSYPSSNAKWDASLVVDASGKTQQEINDNLDAFIFPQNYGGKFDGVTDIAPALRLAAIDAKVKNATVVLTGKAFIGSTVDIDCNIEGRGAEIYTAGSSRFDVLVLNNAKGKKIKGISFKKQGQSINRGTPIKIIGESEDIIVEDVEQDGYNCVVAAFNEADPNQSSIFRVKITDTATGGTWKIGFATVLTLGEVAWSTSMPHNATVSQVQTAINSAIGAGNSIVTQTTEGFQIEMSGAYVGAYVYQPYLSFGLTGSTIYGSAVEIVQYGGGKFIKNLTLTNVRSKNAGEYGFNFGQVDGLTINSCKATHSYFDGIKFTKHVRNVDIFGGYYCFNGTSFMSNSANGDGIDMYAGGENVRIFGGTYNFNTGVGLQLKNDDNTDRSGYTAGRFGLCRKIELNSVEASYNSGQGGLAITINKSASASYAVTDVTVNGGRFDGNAVFGIGVSGGHRVKLVNVSANRNGNRGIVVYETSSDIEINNCNAIANGGTGTGFGLFIEGKYVRVNGGSYIGCDLDGITADTDKSELIRHHTTNIRVNGTASDVTINMPYEAYNSSGRGIVVYGSPSNIVIHQKPTETLVANSSLIYGDIGSTFIDKSGVKFTKVTGTVSTGIWKSEGVDVVSNLNASATVNGGSDLYIIRATTQSVIATLPKSSECIGIKVKFMLFSIASPNTSGIDVQSGDTINGSTSAVSLTSAGSIVELTATGSGWIVTGKA